MAIDKEASRRWRRRIREVMNAKWDPIGVADQAPDEYDDYIGRVAAMLRDGASDAELFAYLNWAETVHMGLPGNPGRLHHVIAAIREVGWMT
jgi:hypothetical protein